MVEAVDILRDRLSLLNLLAYAGKPAVAAIGVLMIITSLQPALAAVALANVVGRVVEVAAAQGSSTGLVVPVAVLGGLLALDHIGQTLLPPLREWVAARVNGGVRQMVRSSLSLPAGVDHLDSEEVRDAATLSTDRQSLFDVGAGADGQLWLMSRYVGAVAAAVVVAQHSWAASAVALGGVIWQRSLMRRQYVATLAEIAVQKTGPTRAARYWSEVAGSLGAKELRVFGVSEWAVERFAQHSTNVFGGHRQVIYKAFPLYWRVFVLLIVAAGIPFLLLAHAGLSGDLSPAALAAAVGGVTAIATVLGGLGWESYSIEASVPQLAALRRLSELHAANAEASHLRGARTEAEPGQRLPSIRFEGVSFRYPGTECDVFSGLDLELHPGQTVALVGENGTGKSTLLELMAGFHTPSEGRVLINGRDLRQVDPAWWQAQIAIVLQQFVRYSLTALENVAFAEANHPLYADRARAAGVEVGAEKFVESLPRGWKTLLSRQFRDGAELSGGQWQRIAIARALYAMRRGRRVVLMDEPTSSLDVMAESRLLQRLTAKPDQIIVVASHRFSTVRRADRIVVLHQGRIVEDGDHATLYAQDGRYARLYNLQAQYFLDGQAAPPGRPAPS